MNIDLTTIALETDKIDNLIHALELPIPASMHVEIMQTILPGVRDKIRACLIAETGENPWKTFEDADDDN